MTEEDLDAIAARAESFSGLQYVVRDSQFQWPWTSATATNQIVDLVRGIPALVAEIRRLRENAEVDTFTIDRLKTESIYEED